MKFNGTIFSKPQQDQLKENIGNELEKVTAKVDEVDARMLNYKGDWVTGDEYHENDVVTGADGHLYEVIKAHTSSDTLKPGNTEYYKAMTANKVTATKFTNVSKTNSSALRNIISLINDNMEKGCTVSVLIAQNYGGTKNIKAYDEIVGATTHEIADELWYFYMSSASGKLACKYIIYNTDNMTLKNSNDFLGNITVYA